MDLAVFSRAVPTPRTLLIALLLLAFAGGFRLWASEHARFTGDESDYWSKSRRVAVGELAPIYGPEITGSEANLPGPAYYYLMAAPQALSASPRAGTAFVVLLHLLAGALLFGLAFRARGEGAGLLALAVFAVAPWDVLYADRIWGSCVVPVWGALALHAAVRSRESTAWQGALLFLCLVLPQLHLSVPVLWLACIALLVLRPPKQWGRRALAIAALLTILAYGPPLIAEIGSNFANSRTILAKGGGSEPLAYALGNPLRVLGYMVLYGSGEIGYHFARGYWGGGFDAAAAYFSPDGWRRFFSDHGPWLGAAGVISILLAAAAWIASIARATQVGLRAIAARRRDALSLEHAMTIALLVGFLGGGLLLLVAKKRFFPHYANILMPMALWPVVASLDRALRSKRLRVATGLALGASLIFMVTSTVRYYLEVDRLNGLANTMAMVDRVLDDGAPAKIQFTHFHNLYAWQMVARTYRQRPLPLSARDSVRWVVHNRAPFDGEVPDGGEVVGGVLLQRIPPKGAPKLGGSEARRNWTRFSVEAQSPDGSVRACERSGPGADRCSYGAQPWQRFGPDVLRMGGVEREVLFMHPIEGAVVRARYPIEAGVRKVVLRYGLSDGAAASDNRAPVAIQLLDGAHPLGSLQADNRPGLHRFEAVRSSTAARELRLEIRTEHEGARIFGFDLELSR